MLLPLFRQIHWLPRPWNWWLETLHPFWLHGRTWARLAGAKLPKTSSWLIEFKAVGIPVLLLFFQLPAPIGLPDWKREPSTNSSYPATTKAIPMARPLPAVSAPCGVPESNTKMKIRIQKRDLSGWTHKCFPATPSRCLGIRRRKLWRTSCIIPSAMWLLGRRTVRPSFSSSAVLVIKSSCRIWRLTLSTELASVLTTGRDVPAPLVPRHPKPEHWPTYRVLRWISTLQSMKQSSWLGSHHLLRTATSWDTPYWFLLIRKHPSKIGLGRKTLEFG